MKSQQNYDAGIYVRLSKDDERAGESVSIENQKLILTKHAQEQGWNVIETYCDDGYSGTNFDRPGVTRLIEDAKDGKINLILVKDLSRFGRNYIQVGQFTDYVFPMIGCRFVALNDGVDTIHNDNDIMPFRNLFNEFQSRDTSKKIKAVKKACAGAGKYLGCYAPFGYKKSPDNKHKFIIDEPAAQIVRKIFDYRCQGYGFRKIAGFLNEEKIPTPRDYCYQQKGEPNPFYSNHMWNDVTLRVIIRNEVYIGNMVQGKSGTLSYKNKKFIKKPAEEWIRVEGTHEPIIEMETWNQCVEIDKRIKKPRSTKEGKQSLFGGLVKCLDCGFSMNYHQETRFRKDGRRVVYVSYMCGNYSRSGSAACSVHIIYQDRLAELVIDDICHHARRVIEDEVAVRRELIEKRNSDTEQQRKADKAQVKSLESRLAELERLMQKLYEDRVLSSGVSETVFNSLMKKYEAERAEKADALTVLKDRLNAAAKDEQDIENFMQMIRKYVAVEALDREMLLELIDYIEIGERFIKDNQKYRDITIHYKFVGKIS